MIHKDCGGKLVVTESMQKPKAHGIVIKRIRVCKKCGVCLMSDEIINGADMEPTYKHRNYYCREDKQNGNNT